MQNRDLILHATKTTIVATTAIPAHSNGNNIVDSLFFFADGALVSLLGTMPKVAVTSK
jgi:hypothetical protein